MPNSPDSGLPNEAAFDTSIPGVVRDLVTQLVWQQLAPDEFFGREEAAAYCQALQLAGYRDWRLPSIIELMSIVEPAKYAPAIDGEAFAGPWIDSYERTDNHYMF